jgi:hypothetical protein
LISGRLPCVASKHAADGFSPVTRHTGNGDGQPLSLSDPTGSRAKVAPTRRRVALAIRTLSGAGSEVRSFADHFVLRRGTDRAEPLATMGCPRHERRQRRHEEQRRPVEAGPPFWSPSAGWRP